LPNLSPRSELDWEELMRAIAGIAGLAMLLLSNEAGAQESPKAPPPAEQVATTQTTPSLEQRLTPPAPASPAVTPRWNVEPRVTSETALVQTARPRAQGESVALMVAGGAVFVAGILAGGDAGAILMIGGAVIGGYGLYLYFR
jgi:hypothetical protein